ncbi:hypothetical protein M413DRAFT_440730 [Hebeloma cylindrosporum]|uniref:Galectin n=1 Tax=Hebeloma cylindrosporum TaxID=76867 RepID=A0A0C3CER5_HEBCY|nr:hypothetical protein M413DRAFT_440730 [Hebeloma cylindrosporum h7]
MATELRVGKVLPLYLSQGMVVAFKSTRFDLSRSAVNTRATHLDLYTAENDIVLRITIRGGQSKVFFNDRADKSLLDGWGEEQSVDRDGRGRASPFQCIIPSRAPVRTIPNNTIKFCST